MQLDGAYSESLGGSMKMPKAENCFEGGGPKIIAVYRRRIERWITSLTTFVWLKLSVYSNGQPGESLA